MKFEKLESVNGYNKLTMFQKLMLQLMHSNADTGGCLLITSPPGLGKTQIIKELANKLDAPLIDIRLSQKDETEVGLYPFVMKNEKGEPIYVKEIPPHWAHLSNEYTSDYVIVVFEELNRARREIQNGALQILMERAIGHDFEFDKKVLFVATSNIDDAYTEELSDAMKGRLVHIPFEFKYTEWKVNWANQNINPIILKWLDQNPEYLLEKPKEDQIAYCSPRSIERLSNCLEYVTDPKNPNVGSMIDYVRLVGTSIIGEVSNTFLEFLKKYSRIKATDIINNYKQAELEFPTLKRSDIVSIVEDLKNIFTDGNTYSTDQHQNVINFLTYEIDGIQMVEDDISVSFIKEFVESIRIEDLVDINKLDPRYKLYIKQFKYEIDRLFERPKPDELIKIFSEISKIDIPEKGYSTTANEMEKILNDFGSTLSGGSSVVVDNKDDIFHNYSVDAVFR